MKSSSSFASAVALVATLACVACGAAPEGMAGAGDPSDPGSGTVLAPPVAIGEADAAPPATSTTACTGDGDCASTDLCVQGTCRRACHSDDQCSAGTCHTEATDGWCYNAPGCNPPPDGVYCPTLCFGYCE